MRDLKEALAYREKQLQGILSNDQTIRDCINCFQTAPDEKRALNEMLSLLGTRLGGDRTYIFEMHGKAIDNTYEWCASHIPEEIHNLQAVSPSIFHAWLEYFNRKMPYVIADSHDYESTDPAEYKKLSMRSIHTLIALPLYEQDTLIGFMGIDNPSFEKGDNCVEMLQLLAYFVQDTLTHIRSSERLRSLTYLDEMTGAKNRNAYMHGLELLNEKLRSLKKSENSTACGVIFADVNGLKQLNDTAGHEAGDRLLIRVAHRIMNTFPTSDVYRTGGDEFVVVCSGIPEQLIMSRADILRQELDGKNGHDSAAIGVSWTDTPVYIEEIINQAEADMYEDKRRYYTCNSGEEGSVSEQSGSVSSYTSLLLKDIDIASIASELLHIILERWDSDRMSILLDSEFVLFEEEYQKLYQRDEALQYLKKQQLSNPGQQIRDMQFVRKRIIRGISIFSCFGRLDWMTEDDRTLSIPVEMTLVFVQKKGRVRCLYMHSTNIFYRSQYEKDIYQVRNKTFLNMITSAKSRGQIIQLPTDEKERTAVLEVLTDAFGLITERYDNIYFVDIQKDSYISLKTNGRYRSLVGVAGNYTGINSDYANFYMDEATQVRYLKFTSRRNLLDHLDDGDDYLSMSFSVTDKNTPGDTRQIEISIWLGILANTPVSVFAYRDADKHIAQQVIKERDKLTGLLSYEKFREEGQKVIDQGADGWVMVSTDIRNFKYMNEVLGYQEGDAILRSFAANLPDMKDRHLYHTRVTADIFLSFVKYTDSQSSLFEYIETNSDDFCRKQRKRNPDIKFVLRSGVYYWDNTCLKIDAAIDRANVARTSIGQSISNEICAYGEEIARKSNLNNVITATMEKALECGNFHVWFQPKISLRDNSLCGAEALVRWMEGDQVYLYPDDFIPVFENSRFITSLDLYVLETVCQRLKLEKERGHTDCPRISVNLSAVDVKQEGIGDSILEIVERCGIDHSKLEFELTETAYFNSAQTTLNVMEQLKQEGFTTSVDDFGSGYSVMNMLANMPASVVKIDRQFMLDSEKSEKGRKFLGKMISIIHELGYRALCEGIETQEQYHMLKEMGCDEGQGYYFSKPLPMDEFFKIGGTWYF